MVKSSKHLQMLFTQTCEDFWKTLLNCHERLSGEQFWPVRQEIHATVLPQLMLLLRIQNADTANLRGENFDTSIDDALSQEERARLKRCIPDRDDRDLTRALYETAEFGAETCSTISADRDWDWPQKIAAKTLSLFHPGESEISILPNLFVKPIGIVRSSVDELLRPDEIKSKPAQIFVDPELSAGLDGLAGGQRLLVIFQFHKLSGYELRQHPKNDPRQPMKGVFALHSPQRPNPIGVTEVDLIRREGNILHVRGLDAVNSTPVLDLKLNDY
jgi:tRNA-Thr(GGU) m(6)t(6)A37 methyltransferase TsaA